MSVEKMKSKIVSQIDNLWETLIPDQEVAELLRCVDNYDSLIEGMGSDIEKYENIRVNNPQGSIYRDASEAIVSMKKIVDKYQMKRDSFWTARMYQIRARKEINALKDELEQISAIPTKVLDLLKMAQYAPHRFKDCIGKLLVTNHELYKFKKGE